MGIRPKIKDYWMDVAIAISQRSLCSSRKVGAIILDKNNRIVASGYNGPPAAFDHDGESCDNWCERRIDKTSSDLPYNLSCPSIHAEANALLFSDRRDREKGSLYVTSFPCPDCAKLIANSGLSSVYALLDKRSIEQKYQASANFLIDAGIKVFSKKPDEPWTRERKWCK